MAKEFVPISIKIKEAEKKLKAAGYVVINENDEKFAILAERKKITCGNTTEFFKKVTELTSQK